MACPPSGGCTFAEDPRLAAPQARIVWRAELDPGTLRVSAEVGTPGSKDLIDPAVLRPWLTVVTDDAAVEHVVLSDGWHRIRLDLASGSLAAGRPVLLRYHLEGTTSAESKLLPLRRLLHLYRHGYFAASLYPRERRVERWLDILRVGDALASGASQKDIAEGLFGRERVGREWNARSDSLRSRIRRLAREAQAMARGGYRRLLRGDMPHQRDR